MQAGSEANLELQKRYVSRPLWLATLIQAARYHLRSLPGAKRYPLADKTNLDGRRPLFIISAGRSGTTLLRSMLVAGGQIAIPPETQVLHKQILKFATLQYLGWEDLAAFMTAFYECHPTFKYWETNLAPAYAKVRSLPEEQRSLARINDIVLMTYAEQHFPAASTWGDQSPLYTFYIPWVRRIFPQARFVHMLRDGRDVISSMIMRRGPDYLAHATYRWQTSIERVEALKRQSTPDQFLEIRYENLVSQPENALRQICRFSAIEYTPQMLDYWKLPTTIEHTYEHAHRNLSKAVTTDSIGKWRERLSPDQQAHIMSRVGGTLKQLGYLED